MPGVHLADSFAWNPHKMMNIPLQCSMIITKHPGLMMTTNGIEAAYLFQPDKLNADQDLGKQTVSCGRKSDSFKLWLAWKAKVYLVLHIFRNAQYLDLVFAMRCIGVSCVSDT